MILTWPPKDPDEVLDYGADWVDELAGDTIALSAWTVPAGLTQPQSSANTTTTATVWLGSGVLGETYDLLNRVTTAGGRTMDCTFKLAIRRK